MLKDPLYMRFFGVGKGQVARNLSLTLNRDDVYSIWVDCYEVVVELTLLKEPLRSIKKLVLKNLRSYFIGYGKNNSIEQIVGHKLIKRRLSITGAESLTAGLFQATLGNVPGISAVFPGGFVTYSNHAKHQLLQIPSKIIDTYGVVSKPVAKWMANQSRRIMNTQIGVSFTGVAGPASLEGQPAGTVWIGLAIKDRLITARLFHLTSLYYVLTSFKSLMDLRNGTRDAVRMLSVKTGLKMVNNVLK